MNLMNFLRYPVKSNFWENDISFPQASIFCGKSFSNYQIIFDIYLGKFCFEDFSLLLMLFPYLFIPFLA